MVRRTLPLLILLLGAEVRAQERPPARAALAGAIRAYFDEGAAAALARLDAMGADGSGAVYADWSWWSARCLLDLGQPAVALDRLTSPRDGNIASWRFDALAAQAAVLTANQGALSAGCRALATAGDGADDAALLEQTRLVVAALAARAGDDARALEALAGLPSPPPALALPTRLFLALPEADALLAAPLASGARLPGPLAFQAAGAWWRVEANGGLARRTEVPAGAVRECAGPDLCHPDGTLVLSMAGIRYSPRFAEGVLIYGAGREPLAPDDGAPGIFALDGGDSAPRRLTRAPEGAFDLEPGVGRAGEVLFLRRVGGHTRLLRLEADGVESTLAPDLDAVGGLAVVGDVAVLACVREGRGALRWVPVEAAPDVESLPLLALPLEQWTPWALTP